MMSVKRFVLIVLGVGLACSAGARHCGVRQPNLSRLRLQARPPAGPFRMAAQFRAAVDEKPHIDVLIAHDLTAESWVKTHENGSMQSFAQARINDMNKCLANTGLDKDFKFHLAGVVKVNEAFDVGRGNDLDVLLDSLIDPYGQVVATGEWLNLSRERERVHADIVAVLVDGKGSDLVGISYSLMDDSESTISFRAHPEAIPEFGDWAYCVCDVEGVKGRYTLLHEIGHLMGCGHPDESCAEKKMFAFSDGNSELGPQLFDYSSGLYFWLDEKGYTTIMGYVNGGLRPDRSYSPSDIFSIIPYFTSSDAAVSYEGHALGDALHDNARTLRETCRYVAQYRFAQKEEMPITTLSYDRAATFLAVVKDPGKVMGLMQLKIGKSNKDRKSKVSAVYTGLDGKKVSSESKQVDLAAGNRVSLTFKKTGQTANLWLHEEDFAGDFDQMDVKACDGVGLSTGSHQVSVNAFPDELGGLTVLKELLPTVNVPEDFTVAKNKFVFGKAAAVKFLKVVDQESGAISYRLDVDTSKGRSNKSGLKLTFSPKSGVVKGSFKVYAADYSKAMGPKPKAPGLKKYNVKVTGVIGEGLGEAIGVCRKPPINVDLHIR